MGFVEVAFNNRHLQIGQKTACLSLASSGNNGEPGRHMQAEVINAAVGYKKESSESPAKDLLPKLWCRLLLLPISERADSERD